MSALPPEQQGDYPYDGQPIPPQQPYPGQQPYQGQPPYQGQQYPQPGQYQQPQQVQDPASNVILNYWLSVFFTWIPALIFYASDKSKGNPQTDDFNRANLNFSLLRLGVTVALAIGGYFPSFIGASFTAVFGIASFVLFIFHIIAASKAGELYRSGQRPEFIFNIDLVK